MTAYVCDRCNARVEDDKVIVESDPDLWMHPMRSTCERLRKSNGGKVPPRLPYHERRETIRHSPTRGRYLCGPLHEETTQEYFVHWVSR